MRSYLIIIFTLLLFTTGAQNITSIASLPVADTINLSDAFPVIQNGRPHRAFISQLFPAGNPGGGVYLSTDGLLSTDSLFNRDLVSQNTFIGTALNNIQTALFRSGLFSDSTEAGAGIFLTDTQTLTPNNLAIVSVTNRSDMGADSFMVYIGAINTYQTGSTISLQRFSGIKANYQDTISSHNSYLNLAAGNAALGYKDTLGASSLVMDSTGLSFAYNGSYVYHFPVADGFAGQALATDGSGNLSWQSMLPHIIFTPASGATVNLNNNNLNIINPAGSLGSLILNFPSAPANNSTVFVRFTQSITTLTLANGTNFGIPDAISVSASNPLPVIQFTYDSTTSTWY